MYFQQWKDYFTFNQQHFAHINFNEADLFCVLEQQRFAASLQQFQKGEHSEGKHLMYYAKQYGDPYYIDAIKLFIKEEQTHALVLGKFLDKHGIVRIKHHWVDGVFRGLRQLSGIQNTVTILLVAEIISKVYYKALLKATTSQMLQDICIQILKDEEKHLHFQCTTIRQLQKHSTSVYKFLWQQYLLSVLTGTIAVVWMYHNSVLKEGGLSFQLFAEANYAVANELLQMIKGQKEIPSALEPVIQEKLIA